MLRSGVEDELKTLTNMGVLMLVGDEYRLQTREGSEWDREFRNRQTKLNSDDGAIQFKRDQQLYGEIDKTIRAVRIVQGAAKEPRQFLVHREQTAPSVDGSGIPIWIRDGWSCAEKDVLSAARLAGIESPVLFAFIPRQSPDDLRRLIVEADASQQTLDAKGNPTTAEGQEARQSMDSRRARAVADRDHLIREILANTKIFQGGGSELLMTSLNERIKTGADASLIRLFPRFKEADSGSWDAVIKRAREGADHPFQPTGHSDATEKHAVCQQVITTIGAGKSGSDVRKLLGGTPFGWPRDAVDAALIALHRLQHITATLNGQSIALGQLDQNKIAKADFRVEQATLSMGDRLTLRKLFQMLSIPCKSGEEAIRASEFLSGLIVLGKSAGGNPPLPASPSLTAIEDTQRLLGNEQLVAIKDKAPDWEGNIKTWSVARDLIAQRMPAWVLIERLAKHAASLPEAKPQLDQIAAIRDERLLLATADPANSVRLGLTSVLRAAVQMVQIEYEMAFNKAIASLAVNGVWLKLTSEHRASIASAVGLIAPTKSDISTDDALADTLDRKSLSMMQADIDAISGRVDQAIERAARILEPSVQTITLERATLKDMADVEAWVERQKTKLVEAVRQGPVLVS